MAPSLWLSTYAHPLPVIGSAFAFSSSHLPTSVGGASFPTSRLYIPSCDWIWLKKVRPSNCMPVSSLGLQRHFVFLCSWHQHEKILPGMALCPRRRRRDQWKRAMTAKSSLNQTPQAAKAQVSKSI